MVRATRDARRGRVRVKSPQKKFNVDVDRDVDVDRTTDDARGRSESSWRRVSIEPIRLQYGIQKTIKKKVNATVHLPRPTTICAHRSSSPHFTRVMDVFNPSTTPCESGKPQEKPRERARASSSSSTSSKSSREGGRGLRRGARGRVARLSASSARENAMAKIVHALCDDGDDTRALARIVHASSTENEIVEAFVRDVERGWASGERARARVTAVKSSIARIADSDDWLGMDTREIRLVAVDVLEGLCRERMGTNVAVNAEETFESTLGVAQARVREISETCAVVREDDDEGEMRAKVKAMRKFYAFERGREGDDEHGSLVVDFSRAASREDVAKATLSGVSALARFAAKFIRAPSSDDDCDDVTIKAPNNYVTFIYEDGKIDESTYKYDMSRVRSLEDAADANVRSVVRQWLRDERDCDAMCAALRALVPDGANAPGLRRANRREVIIKGIAAWRELRAIIAAVEIGHEEFVYVERRADFFLHRNETRYVALCPKEDCDALSEIYTREIEDARAALMATTPSANEIRRAREECVTRTRLANACAGYGTKRVVDAAYAAANDDAKTVLSDAMRDLRASYEDVIYDAHGNNKSASEERTRTMVDASDVSIERLAPTTKRFHGSKLEGVEARIIRAINREGRVFVRASELALCALFAHAFAALADAHAKRADDAVLAAALKEFEGDDVDALQRLGKSSTKIKSANGKASRTSNVTTNAESSVASASTKKRKSSRKKSSRDADEARMISAPAPDAAVVDEATPEVEPPVFFTRAAPTNDGCEDKHKDKEEKDDDIDGEGWTAARSRRKCAPYSPAFVPPLPAGAKPTSLTTTLVVIPAPRAFVFNDSTSNATTNGAVKPAPGTTTSADVDSSAPATPRRRDFPPKPKSRAASMRSIAEYRSMLDMESAGERERRLKEFPALPEGVVVASNQGVESKEFIHDADEREKCHHIPPPRPAPSTAVVAISTTPPPPTVPVVAISTPVPPLPSAPRPVAIRARATTWAEAKRAIDGIKLPSLIKIN